MGKKKINGNKRIWLRIFLIMGILFFGSSDSIAASASSDTAISQTENATGEWQNRNQKFFYYQKGKKVKGLARIKGKTYYFDSKGVQHTGWQKIDGSYYFFQNANGKKGSMDASSIVNGMTLGADGKAVVNRGSKEKLEILVMANEIVEKATKPEMKKSEKLKKTYDYLMKHFKYRGSPKFVYTGHWELDYARSLFEEGHGSCYAFGAGFAFLANAVGYKDCYAVSSGGHGWAEANGKVYDPTWGLIDQRHNYYGMRFDLSGVDGRPNYKRARTYVAEI
ncbi:MAG: hypothetical protein HFH34_02585 [Eubacterium sp.]|nr:hypothetical protein [Eubacterium sp.]